MDFRQLKERQRAERVGYPENLALRVHRALSWLLCEPSVLAITNRITYKGDGDHRAPLS